MSLKYCFFILFSVVFCVFLITLHPTVAAYRDAGDLAVAERTLGIAHPPGYPFYVLLGKAVDALLPLGNPAYRLNVLSALGGAACVALLFLVLRALFPRGPAPFAAILAALSPALWRLSQVSEMYSVHAALAAGIVLVAARQSVSTESTLLYAALAGLLLGVAAGNHQTIILLMPGLAWMLLDDRLTHRDKARAMGYSLLLFIAGVSIYAFLPLRSSAEPLWKWGDPDSWGAFVRMVTRADYGGAKLHPEQSTFIWSTGLIVQHCSVFMRILIDQFTILGVLVGAWGIWVTRSARFWQGVLISLLLAGPGFVILSNLPPSAPTTLPILEAHMVLPVILFVLFIGAGCASFPGRAARMAGPLVAVIAVLSFSLHAGGCMYRNQFLAYDFGKNIQRTMPPGGMIYDPDDDTAFILSYLQVVHAQRPDIKLAAWFRTRWGYEHLKQRSPELLPPRTITSGQELATVLLSYNVPRRAVMVDLPSKCPSGGGYTAVPQGMMCRILAGAHAVSLEPFERYALRGLHGRTGVARDFFTTQVMSYYAAGYSNTGMSLAAADDRDSARTAYFFALAIDPSLSAALNNLGILAFSRGQFDEAEYWYRALLKNAPDNPAALYNLGLTCKARSQSAAAQAAFAAAWEKGRYADAGNELGLMALNAGDPRRAVEIFSAVVTAQKDYVPARYNLGLAYYRLGERDLSRRWFTSYAAAVTDPAERAQVIAATSALFAN